MCFSQRRQLSHFCCFSSPKIDALRVLPLSCKVYQAALAEHYIVITMTPAECAMLTLQAWYMHPSFSVLIGGILPFGAVFIELFFILTSMWLHQFYYLFGFLCLVFVILVITCAEITIVLCYFQLCSEDYHWW